MSGGARQALFWSRVLSAAEALEGDLDDAAAAGLLLALEEGFADLNDPVTTFEAYAALRLCRAARRRMDGSVKP